MIKVFYGENRVKAQEEIRKFLGENYEVVEGADLTSVDLPSLLAGGSLFEDERAILVRDALVNKAIWGDLPKYLDSPHRVVFLETRVDKRSSVYREMKTQVEFKEFAMPRNPNAGVVFDIYREAKRNGEKAVEMAERIKEGQDPMMFLGLMVSQAIKDYQLRQGPKEKKALKELSKLDMELKSSAVQPWLLIEAFLLRLA